MEMKIEYDGDKNSSHPVETTMVGDTLEVYNRNNAMWVGLEMSESEQLDMFKTLWWSLYHSGAISERPSDSDEI